MGKKYSVNQVLSNASPLSQEEQAQYVERYKAGDSEAGGRLIESQIAWIVTLVSRQRMPVNVDPDDVVSELMLIMLDAIKNYDASRTKLSTFTHVVVSRRMRRIIGRLAGNIKYQDAPEALSGIIAQDQGVPMMDELREAVMLTELEPAACMILDLHLHGFKNETILKKVNAAFPGSSKEMSIQGVVDSAIDAIRAKAEELGFDPVPPKNGMKFF